MQMNQPTLELRFAASQIVFTQLQEKLLTYDINPFLLRLEHVGLGPNSVHQKLKRSIEHEYK